MRYDHEYLKIALTILSSDLNHVSKEVFTMLEKIKDPGKCDHTLHWYADGNVCRHTADHQISA